MKRQKNGWDSFTLALFIVPFIAWLAPEIGHYNGFLQSEIVSKIGVMVIFFINGLTLDRATIASVATRYRLHLLTQLFIFLICPGINWAVAHLFLGNSPFLVGVLLLGTLPTTVASSSLFAAIAGGDRIAALFGSFLSNFLAILVTPWLFQLLTDIDVAALLTGNLTLLIFIPLLFGQIASRWAPPINVIPVSKAILILIIYAAFCNSFYEIRRFDSPVTALILLIALIHGLYLLAAYPLSRYFFPEKRVRMAFFFTATQKSVAVGIPIVLALTIPDPGIIALPLLIYTNIQAITAGLISRYSFSI